MRKKSLGVFFVMLLTILASEFTFVSDCTGQNSVKANDKAMSSSSELPEPVAMITTEDIQVFSDGDCYLHILMEIQNSSLSSIFRYLFDFSGDIPASSNKSVPTEVTFEDYISFLNESCTYNPISVDPAPTPVKDLFLNGVKEEHLHSLGINITNVWQGYPSTWGTGGACVIEIKASGSLTRIGSGKAVIGPGDVDASFDRVGFILNKIAYAQQMLGGSSGEQIYVNTWTTRFSGSIFNRVELIGKRWFQDFGNGTSLEADLAGGASDELILTETLKVTENLVSVTPEEFLEDHFLCYKVFHIQYSQTGGASTLSSTLLTYLDGEEIGELRTSGLDPSWSLNLLDETFTIPIADQVTMYLHSQVTLSSKVSWDFKWFRLHKFEAWTELAATIDMTLEVDITYTYTFPSVELIERDRRKFFMVGPIPVLVNLKFTVTAYLETTATAGTVTFQAIADGSMRAGVGWKRGRGWYPIRRADMDFDPIAPVYTPDVKVEIEPSVGFRLSLFFYESAGPFIELKPYVLLTLYPPSSMYDWTFELGIDVNAGIDFEDRLERILRLDDFVWPVFNFVLWRCYECQGPMEHDVAVMSIMAPDKAFVTEPVVVSVDVSNIGNTAENNVQVYLENNASGTWNVIGSKNIDSLPEGKSNTTDFEWDTSTLPALAGNYTVRARVEISIDNDPTNNNLTDWIYLEVQNVRVIEVTARPTIVVERQSVEINATIENNGTATVPSLPVFIYYKNDTSPQPISPVWCESMHVVFDVLPGETRTLTYRWDTTGFSTQSYGLSANITLLPYEIDETDNVGEDGSVNIVSGTRIPDIALISASFSSQTVVKGDIIDIEANVQNSGSHDETLDIIAYTHTFTIQRKVIHLSAHTASLVTLTWNTTGREAKGNYTVMVEAIPFPDETITINNYAVSWVFISGMGHDVVVGKPFPQKTIIGEGYTLPVKVKATNIGNYGESFSLTSYVNIAHSAPSQNIILDPFASNNITLNIDTTGLQKGRYLVCAYAWPVSGETNTADNTFIDGWVIVTIAGDVNGDQKVDMRDIGAMGRAFGATSTSPNWNSNADINDDLKIDMRDIGIAARNFGQSW